MSYESIPRISPANLLNEEQLFLFTEEQRLSAGLNISNRILQTIVRPVNQSQEYVWLGVQQTASAISQAFWYVLRRIVGNSQSVRQRVLIP